MGGFFERLRQAPPWVWISLLLGAGVLIVSWLIYRSGQTSAPASDGQGAALGTVPADGSGQPMWPSDPSSNFTDSNSAFWQAFFDYISSSKTPNAPATATPAVTPGPAGLPGGLRIPPAMKLPRTGRVWQGATGGGLRWPIDPLPGGGAPAPAAGGTVAGVWSRLRSRAAA